jgi:hypothetical protein
MSGSRRSRANGEGSIFPYKGRWAGYVWVTTRREHRAGNGCTAKPGKTYTVNGLSYRQKPVRARCRLQRPPLLRIWRNG